MGVAIRLILLMLGSNFVRIFLCRYKSIYGKCGFYVSVPGYDCTNFYTNDIALLYLAEAVDLEKAGTLPLYDFEIQPTDGTPLFATGWGDTFSGSDSGSDLLQGKQINVDVGCCGILGINEGITFCAGENNNGNTCQGDSGGPVVGNFNGVLYLTGVVSGGIQCGETGAPSIYTRISFYKDWAQLCRESLV